MGRKQGPRKGSLQFWPRKRAEKFLPSVNWEPIIEKNISQKPNILGFVGYKVGMASAFVKDNTANSMTKGKKIIVPVTLIECPTMKIYSIRFYKNRKVAKEILNDNLDKELKRNTRLPKKKTSAKEAIEKINVSDFDSIAVLAYSQVKKTGIKKTPDISEIAFAGADISDKLNFLKENLSKEMSVFDVFPLGTLVDIRGITTGRGLQGPVKRFGVRLRHHKSEKGQRRVGSIGPWHPARISFRIAFAGQMGFFTRVTYNNKIIAVKRISESDINPKHGFKNYGKIKNDYIILSGSVQGPPKRQLLITSSLRPTKKQLKKQYELIELR